MCHASQFRLATPSWWKDDLWLKESFAENQGAAHCDGDALYVNLANFAMN